MGKALYRKHRSKSLSEIVGQEHVTTTLSHALKQSKISHAYLLTGPRGTGKTSIARILAHEINQLPYSEEPHFDIIEIDAASNNGVEDVRELREKVHISPTSAKYKVYIIDEVHMLSKAAFNALLKILEEPPEHVVFMLATTEVHKIPETVISRTQRYSLRPVEQSKVISHLGSIAKKEKIAIDDDALAIIAAHGGGSFRDSISLLDQARTISDHITKLDIEQLLGHPPSQLIDDLMQAMLKQQPPAILQTLKSLFDQGYEPATIASQISSIIREDIIKNSTTGSDIATKLELLQQLLGVQSSPKPEQLLELVLLRHIFSSAPQVPTPKAVATPVKTTTVEEPKKVSKQPEAEPKQITPEPKVKEADAAPEKEPETKNEPALTPLAEDVDTEEMWKEVLHAIKRTHNTLYGIARMAKPSLTENTLTLVTKFPFHQKRLSEQKNRSVLIKCVSELRGTETSITCIVDDSGASGSSSNSSTSKNEVALISNIFGGAELI